MGSKGKNDVSLVNTRIHKKEREACCGRRKNLYLLWLIDWLTDSLSLFIHSLQILSRISQGHLWKLLWSQSTRIFWSLVSLRHLLLTRWHLILSPSFRHCRSLGMVLCRITRTKLYHVIHCSFPQVIDCCGPRDAQIRRDWVLGWVHQRIDNVVMEEGEIYRRVWEGWERTACASRDGYHVI